MASRTCNYSDAGTQTKWKGLTKGAIVRPEALFSPPADATTPPDDPVITEKPQFLLQVDNVNAIPSSTPPSAEASSATPTPSLLERRRNPSGIVPHIDMPVDSLPVDELTVVYDDVAITPKSLPIDSVISNEVLDDEVLPSPPPTHALLSPLPPLNTLHAGHTPPIPDLSQLSDEVDPMAQQLDDESRSTTPQQDIPLTGPLSLPSHPTDGADDTIGLDALDNVLAKIAQEQQTFSPRDTPESSHPSQADPTDSEWSGSRKDSASSTRSSDVKPVDGVILKSPPLNFGAPIGQM